MRQNETEIRLEDKNKSNLHLNSCWLKVFKAFLFVLEEKLERVRLLKA